MGPNRARSRAAVAALVLAAVLLPLGMLSAWSSAVLSDNDRYVDAVAPLAHDPVVQQAVIDHLTRAAVTLFDPDKVSGPCGGGGGSLGKDLGGLGGLASAFMPLAEGPIRAIVTGIVRSPSFARAWTGANRSAHDQLIGILQGDDSLVDGRGCVSLDLGAVLAEAVPQLGQNGIVPITLPEMETPVASIASGDLHNARLGYGVLEPLGIWVPVIWLITVAAAFVLGERRWRSLWLLGAGSAAGMVVLLVGLAWTRTSLADASGDPAVTRAIWDAVAAPVRDGALVALVLAAVAGAVGGWRDRSKAPADPTLG